VLETGQAPSLPDVKKETGQLGPVSRASAEMRLYHSQPLAGFGVFAQARIIWSASASRASKRQRSEDTQ
jgi:hypothetical protein